MYETREMLSALEIKKPAVAFLRDKFFREVQTFSKKSVDIDIRKGKRRVAAYVKRGSAGKAVDKIGYTTETYEPPYIDEYIIDTAEELINQRDVGENVYNAKTPQQRAEDKLMDELSELDDMITRREEIQAAEALFLGQVTVLGGDVISFNRDSDHTVTLTLGDRWDQTTSDPYTDLRAWRRLISQDASRSADTVVGGYEAMESLLANAQIQKYLDNRKIELGLISVSNLPGGVTYYGYLAGIGDLWGYDEMYIDPADGVEKFFVPTKKILYGSSQARGIRLYGAISNIEQGMFAVPRFPSSWTTRKPSKRFVGIESAPLMGLVDVDSFVSATVLS
jgi:hypothetical protein